MTLPSTEKPFNPRPQQPFELVKEFGGARALIDSASQLAVRGCHQQYGDDGTLQKGIVLAITTRNDMQPESVPTLREVFFTPSQIREASNVKTHKVGASAHANNPFAGVLRTARTRLAEYGAPVPDHVGI